VNPRGPAGEAFRPGWSLVGNGREVTSLRLDLLSEVVEAPLRELASQSKNVALKSRLLQLLWERFGKHEDARAAIGAYIPPRSA